MSSNRENPSKSKRIRDYLMEHPDARNKDVVEVLAEFGVTPADVSNAKTQLKKRASRRRTRTVVAGVIDEPPEGVEELVAAGPAIQISLAEIDAAVSFVRQVGSIDRARQLLSIIQQIQQL